MGGAPKRVQAITFEMDKRGKIKQRNRIFNSIKLTAQYFGVAESTVSAKIKDGKALERNDTIVYFDYPTE